MAGKAQNRLPKDPPEISSTSPEPEVKPADLVSEPGLLPPSPISGYRLPVDKVWVPGVSGNPGGQPRGKRISTWLAEFGDMPNEDWPAKGTPAYKRLPGNARIALAQLRKAARDIGDDAVDVDAKLESVGLAAAAWAADRVEGGIDRTVHLTHKQEPTMSLEDAAAMVKKLENEKADEW